DAARLELELQIEKNPSISENQVAEATVWTKGPILRARESSTDMKASIDQLVDKLERQARRYRDKRRRGPGRNAHPHAEGTPVIPGEASPPPSRRPSGDPGRGLAAHREDEAVSGETDEPRGGRAPARARRPRLLRFSKRGNARGQRRLPAPRRQLR